MPVSSLANHRKHLDRVPTTHSRGLSDMPIPGEPRNASPASATATVPPVNGNPANGTPANGVPANGAPANGTPVNGTPADGTPASGTAEAVDQLIRKMNRPILGIDFTRTSKPGPSQLLLDQLNDPSTTNLIQGQCCGGGSCSRLPSAAAARTRPPARASALPGLPDNAAFRSLGLRLAPLTTRSPLSDIAPLPVCTISLEPVPREAAGGVPGEATASPASPAASPVQRLPPKFVTPHAPYEVFAARIHAARELTNPDAQKRTFHFDLDVTDYPPELDGVDFRVGGAIGVQAPNAPDTVDALFDLLAVAPAGRDAPVTLTTQGGRWPTIWGDEAPRSLRTTRRELLTWTVDVQSLPPTKALLRLLAEHAADTVQQTVLLYLCAKQGQAAFCEYVFSDPPPRPPEIADALWQTEDRPACDAGTAADGLPVVQAAAGRPAGRPTAADAALLLAVERPALSAPPPPPHRRDSRDGARVGPVLAPALADPPDRRRLGLP